MALYSLQILIASFFVKIGRSDSVPLRICLWPGKHYVRLQPWDSNRWDSNGEQDKYFCLLSLPVACYSDCDIFGNMFLSISEFWVDFTFWSRVSRTTTANVTWSRYIASSVIFAWIWATWRDFRGRRRRPYPEATVCYPKPDRSLNKSHDMRISKKFVKVPDDIFIVKIWIPVDNVRGGSQIFFEDRYEWMNSIYKSQ